MDSYVKNEFLSWCQVFFYTGIHIIDWYNNGGFIDFNILFILALKEQQS